MMARLLPASVTAYDTVTDASQDVLFPEERAVLTRAVDKRRREFATVRALARTAMGELGIAPAPLLPGPRGAPQWPAGIVGSMTHCDGYRAAAVARACDLLSLGIDAEPNGPLPEGVWEAISLPSEQEWARELSAAHPEVSWGRLLFSIKESIFKAWYPQTRHELGFHEAEITVAPEERTFSFRLLLGPDDPDSDWLTRHTGRWTERDGILVSALAVPR